VAAALRAAGCDLIEVTAASLEHAPRGRLIVTSLADRVRNQAGVMTATLDDIASFADINSVLAAGRADLCAPTRALLFDPHFCRRAAWAQGHELPWPEPLAAARGFSPRD
jgi:anthraniloyl-CoA monooxygenase